MKLLVLLLAFGAVFGAQEFIDGEFFFGLEMTVDNDVFAADLAKYNLELVKFFNFPSRKIVMVKGDEADVVHASKQPGVEYWDRNMVFHTQQCSSGSAAGCWGLDRSDQAAPLDYGAPFDNAVYNWGSNDGAGVKAYIIDSGIDTTHSNFGGRAEWGISAGGMPESDQNGHGTHCAGSTGSDSYGMAKSCTLVAIRVLNALGSGSTGDIVEGLEWVAADHTSSGTPGVGNMSLGGTGSNAPMENAVQACIDAGVSMAIAAGNSDNDACNYTPAQLPAAITVCATDVSDTSASFTNWGTCVDICAPGVDILSTVPGEATDIYDGTSMATPHVCGAIARYLSSNPGASPADVESWLLGAGTPDVINFRAGQVGTPNLLMNVESLC